MSDKNKFKKLFDEIGIEYIEENNLLIIDKFFIDGSHDDTELIISFYDETTNFKNEFQEFRIYN